MKTFFHLPLLLTCLLFTPVFGQDDEPEKDADAPKVLLKEKQADGGEQTEPKKLTIGSVAPKLDIEHWVQDREGHFADFDGFDDDKVYVVEFWATWCGPCISSMPHIVKLQDEYLDRDVQIISISDEKLVAVQKFLDRDVRGDDSKTYRDLTSAYCLTTDPDRSSSNDYMRAAGQNGIPCAFIVGKTGHVEWIGHPMSMDEPLEKVVSDNWDREAALADFAAGQASKLMMRQLSQLMRSGKTKKAVELLDKAIEDSESDAINDRYNNIKMQVLLRDEDFAEQAAEQALIVIGNSSDDSPSAVNSLVWNLYLLVKAGKLQDARVIRAAWDLAERKLEEAKAEKPLLLDTVAHYYHHFGDRRNAIKLQKQAFELSNGSAKRQIKQFLEELVAEKNEEGAEESATDEEDEKETSEEDAGDENDDTDENEEDE